MYYLAISLFISTIQSCTTKVSVSLFSFSSFSRFNVLTPIVSERFLAFPGDGRSCARQGVGQHFRGGCSNHLTKRRRFSCDGYSVAPANDKITVITRINLSIVGYTVVSGYYLTLCIYNLICK